jgi:pimeloyl-ACP methyl ester carboxylesterase
LIQESEPRGANPTVGVNPAYIHYVEVLGRRVRYLDQGAGHPLLLCHGFIGSLENFHTWSPAFAGHRRVLVPDLPGFGETPPGDPPYDVPAQATFLRAFAQALDIRDHDVGGICLGATVALEYGQRFSEQVTRLVLHTPIYSPRTLHPSFKLQAAVLTAAPVFFVIDRLRRNRTVSDLYKRYLVEGPGVDPYDAQVNFDNQCRADGRAARAWLRDGIRRDYAAFLAGWEKPALIVVAADDHVVRVDAIRDLERSMRQAQVRVIAAAGHGWTPALIRAQVEVITAFLAG